MRQYAATESCSVQLGFLTSNATPWRVNRNNSACSSIPWAVRHNNLLPMVVCMPIKFVFFDLTLASPPGRIHRQIFHLAGRRRYIIEAATKNRRTGTL